MVKDSHELTASHWEACSLHGLRKQLLAGFHTSLPGRLGFREDAVTSSFWQRHMPQLLAAASGNEALLRIMVEDDYPKTRSKLHVLCTLAAQFGHASCVKFLLQQQTP